MNIYNLRVCCELPYRMTAFQLHAILLATTKSSTVNALIYAMYCREKKVAPRALLLNFMCLLAYKTNCK